MTRSSKIDAAAVALFAGATAFVALSARGWFGPTDERSAAPAIERSAIDYPARIEQALPRLEALVAEGSMRDRSNLTCNEERALAEIALVEANVGESRDATIAEPFERGIVALRRGVACTPEIRGCSDAARAFTRVEIRLGLPRAATGS